MRSTTTTSRPAGQKSVSGPLAWQTALAVSGTGAVCWLTAHVVFGWTPAQLMLLKGFVAAILGLYAVECWTAVLRAVRKKNRPGVRAVLGMLATAMAGLIGLGEFAGGLPPASMAIAWWVSLGVLTVLTVDRWIQLARDVPSVWAAMDLGLGVIGVVAVVTLGLQHGFREPPVSVAVLQVIQLVLVGLFVADRFARLLVTANRKGYLRSNWIDFVLMAIAAVVVLIGSQLQLRVISAATLYVVVTQVYILGTLALRTLTLNLKLADSGIHPTWLLVGSFAVLIMVGSVLLMLPVARPEGHRMYYDDALFTATSATCVTGLITRDTATEWTPFGQAVILALIQLGGLGFMLFGTVLALLIGKGLSVRGSATLGHMVSSEGVGQFRQAAIFVLVFTLAAEAIGAVMLYPMFADVPGHSTGRAVWDSVFHSVSAFCNAGFSLYTKNMSAGVDPTGILAWDSPLRSHWQMLGVIAPLIVLGGLGFPVLQDVVGYLGALPPRVWARLRGRRSPRPGLPYRVTLHTKLVLLVSAALILVGAGVLYGVQSSQATHAPAIGRVAYEGAGQRPETDWQQMSTLMRIRACVFHSVSARTAGFNTWDMAELTTAGKIWMCVLMAIGGSPASTAGGIKTVTFLLLVLGVKGVLTRRDEVEVFKRAVSQDLVRKASALAVLYALLVGAVTMALAIALPDLPLEDVMFESFSACGTVGLSTGVTNKLNVSAKIVVVVAMYAGRLGPLTLLAAMTAGLRKLNYSYPHENVIIG